MTAIIKYSKSIFPLIIFGMLFLIVSCNSDNLDDIKSKAGLEKYLYENKGFSISKELIACAASQPKSEIDYALYPISVFFLPLAGLVNLNILNVMILMLQSMIIQNLLKNH